MKHILTSEYACRIPNSASPDLSKVIITYWDDDADEVIKKIYKVK